MAARSAATARWLAAMLAALCGCEPATKPAAPPRVNAPTPAAAAASATLLPPEKVGRGPDEGAAPPLPVDRAAPSPPPAVSSPAEPRPPTIAEPGFAARFVDADRAAAHGIRKLVGRRLVLYTDLPPDPEVDGLPAVFEQAWPQWCAYFGAEHLVDRPWVMTGFLMREAAPFAAAGLVPPGLPRFRNGYNQGYELWMFERHNAYNRRHLLLHEGTHGFMNTVLGGCGPAWYMEGVAELLATHAWRDGQLALGHFPASRDDAPDLGRLRLIREAAAAGRIAPLADLFALAIPPDTDNMPYAWSWALAALLDGHPRYRARFREAARWAGRPEFQQRFEAALGEDRAALAQEWLVYAGRVDYGYDVARQAIEFRDGRDLAEGALATATIDAARGWQSAGVRVEPGRRYRVTARGRYQVHDQPAVWWSEPNGVSIRYVDGRPLGVLLGAVLPDQWRSRPSDALLRPVEIGLETVLAPEAAGTLYLRINDGPSSLADNRGGLEVRIALLAGRSR